MGAIMEFLKLLIDKKTVEVKKGTTILQAAKSNEIDIPTHCHDDNLRPYGACRMCMVEISKNNKKRLVAACLFECEEGLIVKTRTTEINKIRKMIIELTWPLMSEYAEEYGAQEGRFENANHDCALCGKCIRFCEDSKLWDIVYFKGRGINRDIDLILKHDYDYSVYKECLSYCPGGRLTNRIAKLWS
jgi:NADH dehydrogenase/NADH:ubiquinone oxidoreductase subunit G